MVSISGRGSPAIESHPHRNNTVRLAFGVSGASLANDAEKLEKAW
jgi:hypothetical protein